MRSADFRSQICCTDFARDLYSQDLAGGRYLLNNRPRRNLGRGEQTRENGGHTRGNNKRGNKRR
eukprot:244871-Lingulodinium_polyedra.AAC.1